MARSTYHHSRARVRSDNFVLRGAGNCSLAGIVPEAHGINTVLTSNPGAEFNQRLQVRAYRSFEGVICEVVAAVAEMTEPPRPPSTASSNLKGQVLTEKRFEKVPDTTGSYAHPPTRYPLWLGS